MGSAESKVAAQPLAVVTANDRPARPSVRRSGTGWPCGVVKKQNKTAPATVPSTSTTTPAATSATMTATKTPRSTPTIEALKPSKEMTTTTSLTSSGPSVQILAAASKAVSLHQLSFEELSTQLLKAVKNGDQRLVERIVELAAGKHWAILNIRGMWESTPLIYACQYCHEPLALWLLQQGADVHLRNEKGVSALLLASLEGMTSATQQMLLRHSSDTSSPPAENSESSRLLIDAQVGVVYNSVADVNVRASPLLAASMNGHEAVVKLLLEHGADVNHGVAPISSGGHKASSGNSTINTGGGGGAGGRGVLQFPLLVAAKYGHTGIAQLLIEHGADLGEMDGNENHALLLACEAAKEDCALALLRLLQASSEDHAVWKRANFHGFTPLHFCAVHGLGHAAEFMLRTLGWEKDLAFVNATSSTRQESAVLMAVRKKRLEMVKLLLQNGADAALADRGTTTALDVLKRDKRDELVQLWQDLVDAKKADATVEAKTATRDSTRAPVVEEDGPSRCDDEYVGATELTESVVAATEGAQVIHDDVHECKNLTTETQSLDPLTNIGSESDRPSPDEGERNDTNVETQDVARLEPVVERDVVPASPEGDLSGNADLSASVIGATSILRESTPTEESIELDTSLRNPTEESEEFALPEAALCAEDTVNVGDRAKRLPHELHELPSQEEDVTDLVSIVPRKPLGSRSKATTTDRKAHNRRPTGFVAEPKSKAKSLSNLGALAVAPPEGNEGEDVDHAQPADHAEANRTESPPRHAEDTNEEDCFHTTAGRLDDPLDGEMSSAAVPTQASSSPSKTSDRHKKKKRHSKKKHLNTTTPFPTTEDMAAPTLHEATASVSVSSLSIPPESSALGDLDDNF